MVLVSEEDYLDTYKSKHHGRKVLDEYRVWFPVEATPELAGLIGDLTTDGHVQGYPKLRFDFTSSNENDLEDFEKRLKKSFDVEGDVRENETNPYSTSYNYGVNSKPLTRILIQCGVPTGNKVKSEFGIPDWILNRKRCFKAYVERILTNDGSAHGENPRITIELYKQRSKLESLESYMEVLNTHLEEYFDVQGSVFVRDRENERKDGVVTVPAGLNIRERKSIKKFHENLRITDKQMAAEIEKAMDR